MEDLYQNHLTFYSTGDGSHTSRKFEPSHLDLMKNIDLIKATEVKSIYDS